MSSASLSRVPPVCPSERPEIMGTTTPAAAALKSRYPGAEIDFLVEESGAQALAGNPYLRRILVYGSGFGSALAWPVRVRRERYDWVIDYLGNPRSAFITAASGAAVNVP